MRLIDADELKAYFGFGKTCEDCEYEKYNCTLKCEQEFKSFYNVCDAIDAQETIDAVPLINGHWIDLQRINQLLNTNVPVVHCNYCGISFIGVANSKGYMYKYCPVCGKRLDGEAE